MHTDPARRGALLGYNYEKREALDPRVLPPHTNLCENVRMARLADKKRESHFVFCTPHPCPEWGVSLYFEKCLPAFCVVGGIDCVRDSKIGTP